MPIHATLSFAFCRSMEYHIACLNNLCRICGTRYSENTRKPYQCASYEQQLQSVFEIQINGDNHEIHPNSFCVNCYACMRRHEDGLKSGSSYLSTLSPRQGCHTVMSTVTPVSHMTAKQKEVTLLRRVNSWAGHRS